MSILEIGHEMSVHVPDRNGVYKTPIGEIGVEILQWQTGGIPKRIKLESDLLRGTPKKHWKRRKRVRVVDLGYGGRGEQRMSKREVLIVRPDMPTERRYVGTGFGNLYGDCDLDRRPYDIYHGTGNPI